jgi:hypothetical protein
MSTAKKSPAPRRVRKPETWGTRAAAAIRADCNKLTRAEQDALLERAMQIAYGAEPQPTRTRRR